MSVLDTSRCKCFGRTIFVLTLVFIAHFILAGNAVAQSDEQCTGVDLVLLLDESASISKNDPDYLRVEAARLAIDSLGDNVLYSCPNVTHRIAIIGFGDQAGGAKDTEAYIDSADIAPRLDEFSNWVTERNILKERVPKRTDSLGATDFLSAFQAAEQTLANWKSNPPDNKPHLRGVVLIADGGPCVIDLGCLTTGNSMNTNKYMADLETYLDPNGNVFPWRGADHPDSIRIWLIAFNDTTVGPAYNYLNEETTYGQQLRASWQQITEGHGGSFIVLDSSSIETQNRDVSVRVAEILDDVTGSELIETTCQKPFYIAPYLDRTLIRILKIGSDSSVPLEDVKVDVVYEGPESTAKFERGNSNGNAGKVVDYRSDGPNEFYVIEDPAPGTWRIQVQGADECRDLKVSYEEFPLAGKVVTPTAGTVIPQYEDGEFYDPEEPVYFEFVILGRDQKHPILSLTDFPMHASVDIFREGDLVQQLELTQQSDGVWRSTKPLEVPLPGRYNWSLSVTALDGEGKAQKKRRLKGDKEGSFDVSEVDRFRVKLLAPRNNQEYPLNRIDHGEMSPNALSVAARVVDDNDKALTPKQLGMTEPNSALSVRMDTISGESPPLPMTYNAAENVWKANLTAGTDGIPVAAGAQTVTVMLAPNAYDRLKYRPVIPSGRTASATIVRPLVIDGTVEYPTLFDTIPQYDEGSLFDPEAPAYFEYRLYGMNPNSTESLPLPSYPLTMSVDILINDKLFQVLSLAPEENGLWRSAEPLKVPFPGQYKWKLKAGPERSDQQTLLRKLEDEDMFYVSEVKRFHYEIVKPTSYETYPLNQIANGRQEIAPLHVEVHALDDESGEQLSQDEIAKANANSVFTVTIASGGASSIPIALSYNADDTLWESDLLAGQNGVPDRPGVQVVSVKLNEGAIDTIRYRPSFKQEDHDVVEIERTLITPVRLEVEPISYRGPTYQGELGCINATVVPITVDLIVLNGQTGQQLDPAAVTVGDATAIASAQLVDPETGDVLETGIWEPKNTATGVVLRTSLGISYTVPGRYVVQIMPNPEALEEKYQLLEPDTPLTVPVDRTQDMINNPQTCKTAGVSTIALLALLVIWMIISWLKRPTGYLELFDPDDESLVHTSKRLGRSIGLFFRARQTIRPDDDPQISKIIVTKGNADTMRDPFDEIFDNEYGEVGESGDRSQGGGGRAISIKVYDNEGVILIESLLTPGEEIPLTEYSHARYT